MGYITRVGSRQRITIMKTVKLVFFIIFFLPSATYAQSALNDPSFIAEGGRLYDKWWAEYNLEKPSTTHPAYPKAGKKTGASTWRCKECHGWDYKGAAGAYSKGSHYTGIKGISDFENQDIDKIIAILKDSTHRYDSVMNDYGLQRIAAFVSYNQVDIADNVDSATKKVNGNAEYGQPLYKEWCKGCHGVDGKEINFKDEKSPEYVGTVAVKNPWEAMHKLRYGHPGAFVRMMMMRKPMPHMHDKITIEQQLDLLAYLQTLPTD